MADLGGTFDPNEVPEDDRNFEPVPAGDYLCQVIDSDVVETKAGNGSILKLTIEIIDGQYANRKVFENLNIANQNAQAQSIAQRALADICLATNAGSIRDSEELHFRPFVARLKIEPAKDGYEAKNKVSRYKPAQHQPPAAKAASQSSTAPAGKPAAQERAAQAAPHSSPAQQSNGPNRPWKRQPATAA
jgi:hypothetical protein